MLALRALSRFATFRLPQTSFRFLTIAGPVVPYADLNDKNSVKITFIDPQKGRIETRCKKGDTILVGAQRNKINIEGACDGSLACSTCHIILQKPLYDKLGEPSTDEMDMLDLAPGLTETSRLGCQINISDDFANAEITLPASTINVKT